MRRPHRRIIQAAIMILVVLLPAAGQGKRTGTSGATQLLIPSGSRGIAMAGAVVSMTRGLDALFWNPAGAAYGGYSTRFAVSHMQYIADINMNSAGVSVDVPSIGVLSLGLRALSIGDIPVTTVATPDGTGETFTPQFFTFGLTYSKVLTDRISFGTTVTLISETMADVSATGMALTMGVIYNDFLEVNGMSFGVVVKNIGPQMRYDGSGLNIRAAPDNLSRETYVYKIEAASFELPSSFEIGLGYRTWLMDGHAVQLGGSYQNNNFLDDEYKIGAEYDFMSTFFIRGGYNYSPAIESERENIFGLTYGVGVQLDVSGVDMSFDYAYRDAKFFSGNHVFTLNFGM